MCENSVLRIFVTVPSQPFAIFMRERYVEMPASTANKSDAKAHRMRF